jgi:hypothetical protein
MSEREELRRLIDACRVCRRTFDDNAAILVADDGGVLTDAQVVAVLDHLREQHEGAQHVR